MKNESTTVSDLVEFREHPYFERWCQRNWFLFKLAKEVPTTGYITKSEQIKCFYEAPNRCRAYGDYRVLLRVHQFFKKGQTLRRPALQVFTRRNGAKKYKLANGNHTAAYLIAHELPCLVNIMECGGG